MMLSDGGPVRPREGREACSRVLKSKGHGGRKHASGGGGSRGEGRQGGGGRGDLEGR